MRKKNIIEDQRALKQENKFQTKEEEETKLATKEEESTRPKKKRQIATQSPQDRLAEDSAYAANSGSTSERRHDREPDCTFCARKQEKGSRLHAVIVFTILPF